MIVVDTSAMIEVLLRTPHAKGVESWLYAPDQVVNAPHLIEVEIAQVIRRYVARGNIDESRGRAALRTLSDMDIDRHGHRALLPRIWALRHNMTSYDAIFFALAETLDAVLLTRDRRLAAAPGLRAHVELV